MKKLILLSLLGIAPILNSQVWYDFTADPLTNGWSYYDDYASPGTPDFNHNMANGNIEYALTNNTQSSIFHTQLDSTLSKDYCVSFKITPTDVNNYNSFFPLLLAPYEIGGSDPHPWRMNGISPSTCGAIQNLDLIGVMIQGTEIQFLHRDNDIVTGTTVQSFSSPFNMQTNYDYWIKLDVSNTTTVNFSVYQDAAFTNQLATETFTIAILDDMNHLYIADGNGNSTTTQFGILDDYKVNMCSVEGLEEEIIAEDNLYVYPNPVSNVTNVDLPANHGYDLLKVMDFQGKLIMTQAISEFEQTVAIDCETLAAGSYFVTLIGDNKREVIKLIKE